jgi:hypothetical protein
MRYTCYKVSLCVQTGLKCKSQRLGAGTKRLSLFEVMKLDEFKKGLDFGRRREKEENKVLV